MSRVFDAIRTIARDEAERLRVCELAVVSSVHPREGADEDHACTVELRDSGLVLPRVPVAVGVMGMAALPRVGDLVAVLFASGDVHAPIIVGRLYHDQLAPPEHGPDEVVLRLPAGEESADARVDVVAAAPDARSRRIEVVLDGDATVKLTLRPGELEAQVGEAKFVLRQAGGPAEATIETGGSTIRMSGNGDMSIEATQKLELKAPQVEIKGDIGVKINGTTVELN